MNIDMFLAQQGALCAIKNMKMIIKMNHLEELTIIDCGVPTTLGAYTEGWENLPQMDLEQQKEVMEKADFLCDMIGYFLKRAKQPNVKIQILDGFKCVHENEKTLKAGDIITVKEESARIAVESGIAKYVESVVE